MFAFANLPKHLLSTSFIAVVHSDATAVVVVVVVVAEAIKL